jgi:hypothetical protein
MADVPQAVMFWSTVASRVDPEYDSPFGVIGNAEMHLSLLDKVRLTLPATLPGSKKI